MSDPDLLEMLQDLSPEEVAEAVDGLPETAVLALLESPLGQTLNAVATGTLADLPPLVWRDGAAVTVVVAAVVVAQVQTVEPAQVSLDRRAPLRGAQSDGEADHSPRCFSP